MSQENNDLQQKHIVVAYFIFICQSTFLFPEKPKILMRFNMTEQKKPGGSINFVVFPSGVNARTLSLFRFKKSKGFKAIYASD